MKLKKIASLAAAGVMAVSMLTACQTTSNDNNDNQGTNPPVETSGLSAAVEARLGKDLLDYVTLKDSTELDADLEYAVEYVGVREIVDGYVNVNNLLNPVESGNFVKALKSEVGVNQLLGTTKDYTVTNIGNNETLLNDEKASEKSTEMRDAVAVKSYVISGQIGDRAVQQKIADAISNYIYGYQYTVNENGSISPDGKHEYAGGNWNHEYTVSISACTVDCNSVIVENNFGKWMDGVIGAENPYVTYVAVQVVRTSTHQ